MNHVRNVPAPLIPKQMFVFVRTDLVVVNASYYRGSQTDLESLRRKRFVYDSDETFYDSRTDWRVLTFQRFSLVYLYFFCIV